MRGLVAVALALAVLAVLPAGASAATICVGEEASGCEASAATVQSALELAQSSPAGDRVVVGAGTFQGPFSYLGGSGGGRIEVVGQGPATVLTAKAGAGSETVLALSGDTQGDGAAVSNLTVRLPANTNTTADTGIYAETVSGVRVASDANEAPDAEPKGVILSTGGGSLRNSVIELVGGGGQGIGVLTTSSGAQSAPTTIADSRITAPFAVKAGQATDIVRSRVLTIDDGVGVFACAGPVIVEDSLVRVSGSGIGLQAFGGGPCGSAPSSLHVMQDTVVGTGDGAGQVGAKAQTGAGGGSSSVDISLSILRDLQVAFDAVGTASGSATLSVGASDFEAPRHLELSGGGTATFQVTQPNIDADPLFANELLGEFTLRPGSPAIDSSYSPPPAPGESATDLNGNPRVLDGNGDGVAARDMGAYEAPAVPPPPDTTPPDTRILRGGAKKRLKAGSKGFLLRVRFASSEPDSTFECRLDAGRFLPCASPFEKRIKAGVHRFEVRAIDAAGNVDPTPARETLRVARPPHRHHAHGRHRHL